MNRLPFKRLVDALVFVRSSMVTTCDVLVVGAGPGGGSAALHASRLGLDVIVIEDHQEIGTPVHCGECISDIAVSNLDLELPQEVISKRVHGIRVIFPDGTKKCLTEHGYVLEKHLFEQWLIGESIEFGAKLFLGHKLQSMERIEENGRFWGHLCEGKGEEFPIKARIVIDASGVAGICSKLLELNERPKVIAGMQYELLEVPTDDYLDFYIWPEYVDKGYLWMIPKCDGRANVGLVTEDKSGAVKELDRFISNMPEFNQLEIVNPPWRDDGRKIRGFGGTIPISGPHQKTHSDGILLIGDAAGFTSPLFEGGSHLALKSAQFAAITAAEAISKNDVSSIALAGYSEKWKSEFPPYHKILRGKSALYSLSEKDMSTMAKCFPDEMSNMGISGKAMVVFRLLVRRPSLFFKRIIPAMLAFGYSRAKHYGW